MRLRWLLFTLALASLLVPAGLVTTARLLDLPGGSWVRLVAFTPYAGVLDLVALLALLPLAVWGRGFGRGAARVLAAGVAVALVPHGYWAGGAFLGTGAARVPQADRLHVMTANLLEGRADATALVDVAAARDVDVLVLEEITPDALAALRSAGLRRTFRHAAGRPEPGAHGTMVFATAPLRRVTRLDTGLGSYAMDVRLPGGAVRLLAVHPRPPLDVGEWWADQRVVRQAARGPEGRTMIVGDLNATMDHAPMRELVGRGYADAATQAASGWQPTWPAAGQVRRFGVPLPSLVAIDHVLLSDGLRAAGTETETIPRPDHPAPVAQGSWGAAHPPGGPTRGAARSPPGTATGAPRHPGG